MKRPRETGVDPNQILTGYGLERFLYRLSRAPFEERFVHKGALLLLVRLGDTVRPTRDADLLGLGELSNDALTSIFRDFYIVDVEPDGVPLLLSPDTRLDASTYRGRTASSRTLSWLN